MKRPRTCMSVFLGAWLAALIAGYLASRASVFAGIGQNDCLPCTQCTNYSVAEFIGTLPPPKDDFFAGYVDNKTDNPDAFILLGKDMGGADITIYGTNYNPCDNDYEYTSFTLENVYWLIADVCNWGGGQAPKGAYVGSMPSGVTHTGFTLQQRLCYFVP